MSKQMARRAGELAQMERFSEALELYQQLIEAEPESWNYWYMAGQCHRFLGKLQDAERCMRHAVLLEPAETPVLNALGIVLQLQERYAEACRVFAQAIAVDPDHELAWNSLALTQRKAGEFEKAAHNYDAGLKALARKIVKAMKNSSSSSILKHRDTVGHLWVEHAMFGAMFLVTSADNIGSVAWPTGEQATEEERTEEHGGLFWQDLRQQDGTKQRLFFPNYFNTFRETLRQDGSYANLVGNRGTVLELLGRHDEAQQHFDEAQEFMPRASSRAGGSVAWDTHTGAP